MKGAFTLKVSSFKPHKVNKFGSVKAIIDENERMERAGLFVIHPYSNFRLMWDMFTFVMLALNIILIPIFMAFPIFEFTNDKVCSQEFMTFNFFHFFY